MAVKPLPVADRTLIRTSTCSIPAVTSASWPEILFRVLGREKQLL
jgi:hypothetical protein